MNEINTQNYLTSVRTQYEEYPYPPRKEDETCISLLDQLEMINHHLFRGENDFNNFRILVAGCGTGDSVVWLGCQLRLRNATIIALDISMNSLDVCRKRVEYFSLTNIEFMHGSLLDLPTMGLEPFDYVNCTGVLHHLTVPLDGFKALKSVLKPNGGMSIMVYGKHGRTGIYKLQDALRLINRNTDDMHKKVTVAKKLLENLPTWNWFRFQKDWFSDTNTYGDVGVYDLLLHSQDRAYEYPELEEVVSDAGLRIVRMIPMYKYNPEYLVGNEAVAHLTESEKRHLAELLCGNIFRHAFYATHADNTDTSAKLSLDKVGILGWNISNTNLADKIVEGSTNVPVGTPVNIGLTFFQGERVNINIHSDILIIEILRLMDGNRTFGEIIDLIRENAKKKKIQFNISDEKIMERFKLVLFNILDKIDCIILGQKGFNYQDTIKWCSEYKEHKKSRDGNSCFSGNYLMK